MDTTLNPVTPAEAFASARAAIDAHEALLPGLARNPAIDPVVIDSNRVIIALLRAQVRLAVAFALLALVAACGSTAPGASQPLTGTSAPASGNVLVCQHYAVQRSFVLHLAEPDVADALKFIGWLGVDGQQSTGKVHADLVAMLNADAAGRSPGPASSRLLTDCEALGVKFSPAV